MAVTGRIFDIKRYSIHDGPGIRTTVFLKGCGLRCQWCHNPESIDPGPDLMHWPPRCVRCYSCLRACPLGAISRTAAGAVEVDRQTCDLCGRCAEACLYDAMQIVGRDMTVGEVVAEVERDRIFYEQSGGGVTLSGGDPVIQAGFAGAVLDACRARGLHTALDTAGFSPAGPFENLARRADLVLYDVKTVDEARHKEFTGASNALILENLRRLAAAGPEIWVRIPVVPGVNDDEANIGRTIDLLASLGKVRRVGLLPYHAGGADKAARIGRAGHFRRFEAPSAERLAALEAAFRAAGFDVRHGG